MLHYQNPNEKDFFGQELVLNLYDCDLKKISSGEEIKKFVIELCDKIIKMKRFGEPTIPHFGHENPLTSGYSLVQLIETSSVTGHFSEYKKVATSIYFPAHGLTWKKQSSFAKNFSVPNACRPRSSNENKLQDL